MNLGRSLARFSTAKALRGAGGSYSFSRALSLLAWPWGRKR